MRLASRSSSYSLFQWVFFLTFLILISSYSILQQNCIKNPTPQKFAILTTTYIRKRSTTMFEGYLKKYAQSDCPLYDNIYIIWNNKQSPQQLGVLKNKQSWKKNVYFLKTIQNSLDFKYIVPPWVPQTVFFGMDDDFDIKCEAMKIGFQKWRQYAYGQIGPLASFYGRSYVFQPALQSFTYIDQIKLNKNWNYYHFGLTGIAFISRHFLDLYYSDIYQIKQMRKQVILNQNCQDLLLNFLINYLYPQLTTQYIDTQFKSLGMTGVSSTTKHRSIRAQCITLFSDILGYNPLRYIKAKDQLKQQRKQLYTNINNDCIVNIKKQHYEKNFINNRAYYLYIQKISSGVINEQKSLINIDEQNKRLIDAKINIEQYTKNNQRKIEKYQQVNNKNKQLQLKQNLNNNEIQKQSKQEQIRLHFNKNYNNNQNQNMDNKQESLIDKIKNNNNNKNININNKNIKLQEDKIKNRIQQNIKPIQFEQIKKISLNQDQNNNRQIIQNKSQYLQHIQSSSSYGKTILYLLIILSIIFVLVCLRRILNRKQTQKNYQQVDMQI